MKAFSAQKLLLHGTTSKFIPTILSQGLVPKPKNRTDSTWKTPYDGSYWSNSLADARNYAEEASEKFGGDPAYVFAMIETQDPDVVVDEDELQFHLEGKTVDEVIAYLGKQLPNIPRKRWEARRADIQEYLDKFKGKAMSDFTPEENAARARILNKLKDLTQISQNVRVKDKAVGYKGSTKIVFIAKIVNNKIVPVYGQSFDAIRMLSRRYSPAKALLSS